MFYITVEAKKQKQKRDEDEDVEACASNKEQSSLVSIFFGSKSNFISTFNDPKIKSSLFFGSVEIKRTKKKKKKRRKKKEERKTGST